MEEEKPVGVRQHGYELRDRGVRVVRARVLMKCETFWQLFCPPRPSSNVDIWWCGVYSFMHSICVRGPSNKSVNPPED